MGFSASDVVPFTQARAQLSELESLLGRGVDLVEPGAVRNPFVLASINQYRESIYAA